MIRGGIDGSNTQTGNKYKEVIFLEILRYIQNRNYSIKESSDGISKQIIHQNGNIIGNIFTEKKFYKFFNIDWKDKISKEIRPDIGIFINKTLIVIECKSQSVNGSVDEKLQTCDFKKSQYEKLMFGSNIKVEYIYVLNSYFSDSKYKDVLDYIKSVKCYYYFEDQIGILIDNIIKFGVLY